MLDKQENYRDYRDTKNYFLLNLVFADVGWTGSNIRSIKIKKLLTDIPPSRLDEKYYMKQILSVLII